MADNVLLNAGSGGDTIAADDVGGAKYQYVKPAFGVDGTATIVSSTNPLPATLANGSIGAGTAAIGYVGGTDYETVAASQTAQVLGPTGATGDYVNFLLVIPATTSPGNVLLLDNATSITVFTGGASSVSNLVPFPIPLMAKSASGAWKVTTGANVSVIGVGKFT